MLDSPVAPGSADAVRVPVGRARKTTQPRMLSLAPLAQAAGLTSGFAPHPGLAGLQGLLATARASNTTLSGERK